MTSGNRDKARALDALLVAAARMGDRAALGRLAAHRGPRLLAHARRLCDDTETARDIVQEAWVEVIRALPRLQDEVAFLPWALRIVTRRAARNLRGRIARRRLAAGVAADPVQSVTTAPAPEMAGSAALTRAIAALPPDQRIAVALFYTEELTLAEVAEALDIPAGTVKSRLFHARATLRAALQGEHDGPS